MTKRKVSLKRAICVKLRRQAGLSILELLMTTFILALCTGIISDTMALGAKHLKRQTKQSQAIILLDTLCAVVQNDLTYVTEEPKFNADGTLASFKTTVEDTKKFETEYGIGIWDSSKALSPNGDEMDWQAIPTDKKGEIIRRGIVDGSEPQCYYYSALTPSQDYSNKSMSHVTGSSNNTNDDLRAAMEITKPNQAFHVKIEIYDGSDKLLASREEDIFPIKEI